MKSIFSAWHNEIFLITFIIYLSWRWCLPGNNLYFTFCFIFSFDFIKSTQCFTSNTSNWIKINSNILLRNFKQKKNKKYFLRRKLLLFILLHAIIQIRTNNISQIFQAWLKNSFDIEFRHGSNAQHSMSHKYVKLYYLFFSIIHDSSV